MRRAHTAIILLLLCFFILTMPVFEGFVWDNMCWTGWSLHIYRFGLPAAYNSGTDYVPLLQYELWAYGKIAGSEDSINRYYYYLRIVTLAMDFLGLWYVYKWIGKQTEFYIVAFLCLLNISYVYNTLIWGQVDGIESTLVLISLYYAYKDKMVQGSLFFLLAVNFKLQAIIFLPLFGILFIHSFISRPSPVKFLKSLAVLVTAQFLILLPFMQNEGGVEKVWSVVTSAMGRYPRVGMNASNIWNWLLPGDTNKILDSGIWVGNITYKQGGLFLFFSATFFLLWPFFVRIIRRIKDPENEMLRLTKVQLWLASALLVMLFYYLNTQMHERYVHPAFIFIAAYSMNRKDYFPFVLFSIAYFLSMERRLQFMRFDNYSTFIFEPKLLSLLFAIVIAYLWWKLAISFKEGPSADEANPQTRKYVSLAKLND